MATIDDKGIILNMLANKGVYDDGEGQDPQAVLIYRYLSPLSRKHTYAIFYKHTPLQASEFVHAPILLMEEGTLTDAGRQMLEAFKAEEYPPDDDGGFPHGPNPEDCMPRRRR